MLTQTTIPARSTAKPAPVSQKLASGPKTRRPQANVRRRRDLARISRQRAPMYYRARYYQPGTGRFISEDPIGFGGGINFYAYVKGNPMMYVDPYGLACTWRKMLVTAYCDKGPGSDWDYYRRKKGGVGPGTGASANIAPPGRPAIPQYPYGCPFTVYSDRGDDPFKPIVPVYDGEFHDTGAGWDSRHHNVPAPDWMDIWLPCGPARKWGKQWLWVKICCDECPHE